ncbi:hypothetical protein TrCOL_g13626 [Triparma columacea]|uniref:Uncharacterized protein n=1 Tax=Triparma columacea TaxID=722753 RepID=A0A9W7L1W2_9STRA|nr:hypothetical protein TrCOL_g13626 [Triparma columacea]
MNRNQNVGINVVLSRLNLNRNPRQLDPGRHEASTRSWLLLQNGTSFLIDLDAMAPVKAASSATSSSSIDVDYLLIIVSLRVCRGVDNIVILNVMAPVKAASSTTSSSSIVVDLLLIIFGLRAWKESYLQTWNHRSLVSSALNPLPPSSRGSSPSRLPPHTSNYLSILNVGCLCGSPTDGSTTAVRLIV